MGVLFLFERPSIHLRSLLFASRISIRRYLRVAASFYPRVLLSLRRLFFENVPRRMAPPIG